MADGGAGSPGVGVESIDAAWASTVFGAPVAAVDVKPVGEIAGFASDTARVTASMADGSERRLFAKFVLSSGARGPGMDVPFRHEAAFYRELAPEVRASGAVRLPACVHASNDAIVLEDEVAGTRGAVGDQLAGCSKEEAFAVVRSLARLHAQYWKSPKLEDPELKGFSAEARFGDPAGFDGLSKALASGCAAHRAMLAAPDGGSDPVVPNGVPSAAFDGLAKVASAGVNLLLNCMKRANTLTHMDVRLDNMIWPGDGTDGPILLDWQAYCTGWNIADVAQFTLFNLNKEGATVADIEDEVLMEYRRALLASPGFPEEEKAEITEDSMRVDYRLATAWLAVGDCMCWLEQQGNHASGKPLFSSDRMARLAPSISSNIAAAFVRLNSLEVVEALPTLWTPDDSGEIRS